MSTIKVDTIATRTGSGNITLSNNVASLTVTGNVGVGMTPNTNYGKEVNVLSGTSNVRLKLANSTTGSTNTDGFDLIADGNGAYVWNRENSLLAFATNNDEKLRLHSNGVLACSAGVALGVGVNNTASNVLADYEEGTWNPTVGGNATYNNQQGTYTKIGRYVFVRGDFHINAIGTGSTTTLSGLPFTSANLQGTPHGMISVGYFSNLSQNYTSIGGYVLNNSTGMYFSGNTSGATTMQLNGAATITSNTRILFSVSYITDS